MEVLVLLLLVITTQTTTVWIVAYLIVCYEWLLTQKWLFFCLTSCFAFPSSVSTFGTEAQTHTNITEGSDPALLRYLSCPSLPGADKLPLVRGDVCSPSPVASAAGLEVNHGGLGQVLSSLENSLHMTHFRYPQILRREEMSDTLKTHREIVEYYIKV